MVAKLFQGISLDFRALEVVHGCLRGFYGGFKVFPGVSMNFGWFQLPSVEFKGTEV